MVRMCHNQKSAEKKLVTDEVKTFSKKIDPKKQQNQLVNQLEKKLQKRL